MELAVVYPGSDLLLYCSKLRAVVVEERNVPQLRRRQAVVHQKLIIAHFGSCRAYCLVGRRAEVLNRQGLPCRQGRIRAGEVKRSRIVGEVQDVRGSGSQGQGSGLLDVVGNRIAQAIGGGGSVEAVLESASRAAAAQGDGGSGIVECAIVIDGQGGSSTDVDGGGRRDAAGSSIANG